MAKKLTKKVKNDKTIDYCDIKTVYKIIKYKINYLYSIGDYKVTS